MCHLQEVTMINFMAKNKILDYKDLSKLILVLKRLPSLNRIFLHCFQISDNDFFTNLFLVMKHFKRNVNLVFEKLYEYNILDGANMERLAHVLSLIALECNSTFRTQTSNPLVLRFFKTFLTSAERMVRRGEKNVMSLCSNKVELYDSLNEFSCVDRRLKKSLLFY